MNQEILAPWIPDDDDDDGLENARADIESSDESSDEDEYPDLLLLLLAESDPELEDEEEIIQEDSDANNEITLPMSSNIKTSKKGSIVWRNVPVSQVGRTSTRNVFRPPKCHVSFSRPADTVSLAFYLIFFRQDNQHYCQNDK